MKRKISTLDDDESRLSKLLFNTKQDLNEKLKPLEQNELHVERNPAWIDDDDENFNASVIPNTKSKVLYTEKLKQKHATLMGTPSWANFSKVDIEKDDEILRTVGHLKKTKSNGLCKNFIDLKPLPKINDDTHNEGPFINCIEFHPTMSVSLVAGQSGIVSLFSIGNDKSEKLHSFKLKNWKITAAHFTHDGTEAYIASKYSHSYCIYNLAKATPELVQLPKISKRPTIFQLSPNGRYLATSDCLDEVYLINAASKELLKVLKHNMNVVSVAFNQDESLLYCCGIEGEVVSWDLSTYKPLKKFYDNGCVTASCITTSSCGKLLATGSGEGIVNIYQTSDLNTSQPVPVKTVSNLTTKITKIKFNASSEILAMASAYYPNAVKLVHIPSYNVFANFPKQSLNCHHIQTINFSPNSGYMAMGNNRGHAHLYRLKYFKNY